MRTITVNVPKENLGTEGCKHNYVLEGFMGSEVSWWTCAHCPFVQHDFGPSVVVHTDDNPPPTNAYVERI